MNIKRWKSLTAALCIAILLCGFSTIPTLAHTGGDEGENHGGPTVTEETTTPEPEPTIEPDEGFLGEGNLATRDLFYDGHTNKQLITMQTVGGNTFYIVIDYDKPVDEEGEQYETYFLSMTDETDLLAAVEAARVEQTTCSYSGRCITGAVSTDYPVCAVNTTEYTDVESEPVKTEETGEPTPEEDELETSGNMGVLLPVPAVAMISGGAGWYFRIYRPKHEKATEPEEDYGGELGGYGGEEPRGDEEDDGPPWDEEDDDGEEADK